MKQPMVLTVGNTVQINGLTVLTVFKLNRN